MAADGAEDLDYESDPEEVKRSLTMRRREASDDEDESGEKPRGVDRRGPIHSDDSDGQGGAGEYDEEIDEEELGLEDEEEDEIGEELQEAYAESREISRQRAELLVDGLEAAVPKEVAGEDAGEEQADGSQVDGEEEKKEHEPFAVPTAGAFYMHDDRFRDSSGGRHRRTLGGRKLWESRDDKKWGHDKFEEIAHHDRGYQEGRSSRGHMRGRGRNRGVDHGGYGRGSKPRVYDNVPDQSQGPKNVRGKGTRKYEPAAKNKTQQPSMQNKQASRSYEKPLNTNSERTFTATNHAEFESASSRKNVFASSLNSASPPFYPSASSNNTFTQKRDGQVGNSNRNFRQSAGDNSSMRGKNVADSVNLDKLKIDDTAARKSLGDFGNSVNTRGRGRPAAPAQMTYQPVHHNQAMRGGSLSAAPHGAHRGPSHGRGQKFSGSQPSSPPKTSLSTITTYNPGEVDSVSEANKSKTAIVAKGKGAVQGSGRGSVMYNGAQVVGTAGMGDQNFPGAPTFLPVMQFGGQHPAGMGGVPAVGMAFPGYVGQPQGLGLGNSEMTWLPVLAGAAGAYCPPYIAVDGAYHPRPSGSSTSGSGPSKENNTTTKPNNEWKSSQRPEIVSDEFGQRQNKPRRYSEMNFGQ